MAETTKAGEKWGVLLLAHGAPARLEDVPAFLLNVREGRKLPEAAVDEIVRRYRLIGGSPLLRLTTLQAQALAKLLGRPVYVGMRNWKPFVSEAVGQIKADGTERGWRIRHDAFRRDVCPPDQKRRHANKRHVRHPASGRRSCEGRFRRQARRIEWLAH